MATFGYLRTSSIRQSVETQRHEILSNGYTVDYWYIDEGVSGKIAATNREQFSKMLSSIRTGETVLVAKRD